MVAYIARLLELNEMERLAISPGRPYAVVMNVSGANAKIGDHLVLQGQVTQPDAPQKVAEVMRLPRTDILQFVVLNLLGPKGQLVSSTTRHNACHTFSSHSRYFARPQGCEP
jgi:hypothetical protein